MSYIYDLAEGNKYKTTYSPLDDSKGTPSGSGPKQKMTAGRQPKNIEGALPPGPLAVQYTAKQKQYRLDREKLVDKWLNAGQTLTVARYRSLLKYPLLDFEKC